MYQEPHITLAILHNREERQNENCTDHHCSVIGDFVASKRSAEATHNPIAATATTEEAGDRSGEAQENKGLIPWPVLYGEASYSYVSPADFSSPAPPESWSVDGVERL